MQSKFFKCLFSLNVNLYKSYHPKRQKARILARYCYYSDEILLTQIRSGINKVGQVGISRGPVDPPPAGDLLALELEVAVHLDVDQRVRMVAKGAGFVTDLLVR